MYRQKHPMHQLRLHIQNKPKKDKGILVATLSVVGLDFLAGFRRKKKNNFIKKIRAAKASFYFNTIFIAHKASIK